MRNFLEFIPQTDDIDLSRIDRFQKKMSNRVASICSERAVLYTESFKQQKVNLTFCVKRRLSHTHWLI